MKRNRFTEEQIIGVLREREVGSKLLTLCRKYGISDTTFYNWKAKYRGKLAPEAQRACKFHRGL